MDRHTLSLIGLIFNGLGSLLLLFCPPPVPPREIMPDGREKFGISVVLEPTPTTEGNTRYNMRNYGYKIGAGLLVIGFALQLTSEMME